MKILLQWVSKKRSGRNIADILALLDTGNLWYTRGTDMNVICARKQGGVWAFMTDYIVAAAGKEELCIKTRK